MTLRVFYCKFWKKITAHKRQIQHSHNFSLYVKFDFRSLPSQKIFSRKKGNGEWRGWPSRPLCTARNMSAFTGYFYLVTLRKIRWQRQRERHQTKGLMSKTIAVHVRYKSLYISLLSSAKQQREMTNFALSGEREPFRLIFRVSFWDWTYSRQVLIPTDAKTPVFLLGLVITVAVV